jgi:MerR family mercuric resistance operon transcriptional regulator
MERKLTIGKLAKAAEVNIETIRYYQRCGLMVIPPKPLGGQRHYPASAVQRLRFIKRAQALGFTLAEVSNLLSLDGISNCHEGRELAIQKLVLVKQKITGLKGIELALETLIKQCEKGQQVCCPIIEQMTHGSALERRVLPCSCLF